MKGYSNENSFYELIKLTVMPFWIRTISGLYGDV